MDPAEKAKAALPLYVLLEQVELAMRLAWSRDWHREDVANYIEEFVKEVRRLLDPPGDAAGGGAGGALEPGQAGDQDRPGKYGSV